MIVLKGAVCQGFVQICVFLHEFTFKTLQHKYVCNIENMSHTAIMPNGHIDQTYLPIFTKIQPTAPATLYIIGIYVL